MKRIIFFVMLLFSLTLTQAQKSFVESIETEATQGYNKVLIHLNAEYEPVMYVTYRSPDGKDWEPANVTALPLHATNIMIEVVDAYYYKTTYYKIEEVFRNSRYRSEVFEVKNDTEPACKGEKTPKKEAENKKPSKRV